MSVRFEDDQGSVRGVTGVAGQAALRRIKHRTSRKALVIHSGVRVRLLDAEVAPVGATRDSDVQRAPPPPIGRKRP
jgi:hypothetical protein